MFLDLKSVRVRVGVWLEAEEGESPPLTEAVSCGLRVHMIAVLFGVVQCFDFVLGLVVHCVGGRVVQNVGSHA